MGRRDELYSLSGVIELDEGFLSTDTMTKRKNHSKRGRGSQKKSKSLSWQKVNQLKDRQPKVANPASGHIKMIVINDLKSERILLRWLKTI